MNRQEMYGAMVPDMFNASFDSPYFDYLRSQTHHQFEKVVNNARTKKVKAFAYGFTSHNETWGADYTAHHEGRTTPGIGYVSAHVITLKPEIQDSIEQILLDNNIDPEQATALAAQFAPSIAHIAVEVAVDVLIKRNEDPNIGKRILLSARLRSPAIPVLLVTAYAADFAQEFGLSNVAAAAIIASTEVSFREFISYYGYILTKKESETKRRLSVYGAELARLYMKAVKGLDITVPQAAVADLLDLALNQVESSYAAEVAATLAYLEHELPLHGINSQSPVIAWQDRAELETVTPQDFSLAQNHPNPFNPTTTIIYSLAKDSHVRIKIYNILGQVVAVLVDGFQSKGLHSVTWDAQHQPGGIYIYRLEADSFTASRKMFLQK